MTLNETQMEQMAEQYFRDRVAQFAAGPPCEWEQTIREVLANDDTLDADEREGEARSLLSILEGECQLRGAPCEGGCPNSRRW